VGRSRQIRFRFLALVLAIGIYTVPVLAHTLPISYLFIVTGDDYVHLQLTFNPFELANFSEVDTNKNGRLDPPEIAAQGDKITHLLLENLTLSVDGKKVSPETAGLVADPSSHHALLRAHYRVKARRATITVESNLQKVMSSSHVTQVNCLRGGKPMFAQLDSQSHKATFKPVAPEQKGAKQSNFTNSTGKEP
jgi:hypothetical protein